MNYTEREIFRSIKNVLWIILVFFFSFTFKIIYMKKEMKMLPNGNFEEVISYLQHECFSKDYVFRCREYSSDMKKLFLEIDDDDPFENGYSNKIEINYCPFCGYHPEN